MTGANTRLSRLPSEHIGDADGRVALWLNEQSAYDLADCFAHDDLGRKEILDAVQRAYPSEDSDDV